MEAALVKKEVSLITYRKGKALYGAMHGGTISHNEVTNNIPVCYVEIRKDKGVQK